MYLCAACADFVRRAFATLIPNSRFEENGGRSIARFRESISLGCKICAILAIRLVTSNGKIEDDHDTDLATLFSRTFEKLHSNNGPHEKLEAHSDARPDEPYVATKFAFHCDDGLDMKLEANIWPSLSTNSNHFSEIFTFKMASNYEPAEQHEPNPSISSNTGSLTALTSAASWINRCLASHEACTPDSDTHFYYPRRLVDVEGSGPDAFKIVDTNVTRMAGTYTSLSHCWGLAPPYRLLTATLGLALSGLPLSVLPKTFQDAVAVTKSLGIRYLWVDSLCIIQDDPEDWRNEAACMAEIYSNSICNLAALASSDSHGGLFYRRRSTYDCPACIDISNTRLIPGRYLVSCHREETVSDRAPLLTRAWVVQERFFSKRTLYFGREQLFWECGQTYLSESCPVETNLRPFGPWTPLEYLEDYEAPDQDWQVRNALYSSKLSLRIWWASLIQTYSACNLTFQNDKLVAISAVAKKIRGLLGTEYLAGLWRRTLPFDLCWAAHSPSNRSHDYRAPSWSWAAVDSPLVKNCWINVVKTTRVSVDVAVLLDVTDAEATPVGNDDTGQLLDAWICIQGRPLSTTIGDIVRVQGEDLKRTDITSQTDYRRSNAYELNIHWDYNGDSSQIAKEVCLLPIVEHEGLEGIIVERAPDKGESFFRRIAHFDIFGDVRKAWRDLFIAADVGGFGDLWAELGPPNELLSSTGPLSLPKRGMLLI